MKNKKGKSLIGLLLLLVAVGIFGYFGYSTMGAIKLGLDLAGGVSITYQAKEANPSSEDMADTIYKLQQRAVSYTHLSIEAGNCIISVFSYRKRLHFRERLVNNNKLRIDKIITKIYVLQN